MLLFLLKIGGNFSTVNFLGKQLYSPFLYMLTTRKVVPVKFTASPKKGSRPQSDSTNKIDIDFTTFDFEIHSLMYRTLLQRKTTIKVAKQYILSGGKKKKNSTKNIFSNVNNRYREMCVCTFFTTR